MKQASTALLRSTVRPGALAVGIYRGLHRFAFEHHNADFLYHPDGSVSIPESEDAKPVHCATMADLRSALGY